MLRCPPPEPPPPPVRKEQCQFLNACTLDQFLFSSGMDDEDDPSKTLDQLTDGGIAVHKNMILILYSSQNGAVILLFAINNKSINQKDITGFW
jgi:hypothetical protein